jgi:hypothetical protein
MVVLKRIKSSTLMETLVATVLIVVVFMVASMVLNSLFAGSVAQNDNSIQQELLQLQYRYEYGKLQLPYYDELGPWHIEVRNEAWDSSNQIIFSAVHEANNKEVSFKLLNEHLH